MTATAPAPGFVSRAPKLGLVGGFDGVRSYGASFEALRDEPATRPVFLATLGTVASHTARATFASNLFAAGDVPTATMIRHTLALLEHGRARAGQEANHEQA